MDVPLRVQDARTLAESVFHVFGLERGLQRAHAAARSRARAMRSSVGARRVAALEPSHRFEHLLQQFADASASADRTAGIFFVFFTGVGVVRQILQRSEAHTSELQSLMRNSYAVFCLKTKNNHNPKHRTRPYSNT